MLDFEKALAGRKLFVTGHSGFTGSWLCAWLLEAGAEIFGYSLAPEHAPSLAFLLGVESRVPSLTADIMDFERLLEAMAAFAPDVVIHLAAQPLVRRSYREPLRTFSVNALGTANVLEAARRTEKVRGVVCVTTDKVYENKEWEWGYRENDPLGGKDPYSASKAAAEMVIKGYSSSFSGRPFIATARGGNIIGGGDWSEDRLVPDFVRAIVAGETLAIRYPDATRPWQHVLALVQAYAMLAAGLLSDRPADYARAWNFGPKEMRQYSVRSVMEILSEEWTRPSGLIFLENVLPEARALALDSRSAYDTLGWNTPWGTEEMIRRTAQWYRAFYDRSQRGQGDMRDFTLHQIEAWRTELTQLTSC